ncbi:uncharacterized protein [Choristoneura fumiferana]|uniref:uncharacterized protein n=1 Tax=Choristoneura fumiferana TaxID=7141 RepID=UPI003D1591C9
MPVSPATPARAPSASESAWPALRAPPTRATPATNAATAPAILTQPAMRIPSPSRFPPPANLPPPFAATNKRRLSPSPSSIPRPTIPRLELSPMDLSSRRVTCEDLGTDDDEEEDRSRARVPPSPRMSPTPPSPSPPPPPPPPSPAPPAAARGKRHPPLAVTSLPEWPRHFRVLEQKLGHPVNAKPLKEGIIFTPRSEAEYRVVQDHLEKTPGLAWNNWTRTEDLPLKVAIRGLPANTTPEDVVEGLREKGFLPIFAVAVRARAGRPGCIFHAQVEKNSATIPGIYNITTLLGMRGVKVEAWRGRPGPAQCHRCQAFRHSSVNCHHPQRCVRCGEGHAARDCQRPREDPPTCANCGGPHTANSVLCPEFQREARHKTAGVAPRTRTSARARPGTTPTGATATTVEHGHAPHSLMAAANDGSRPPLKRRRKRGGRKKKASNQEPREPQPKTTAPETLPKIGPAPEVAAPAKGKKAKPRTEVDDGKAKVIQQLILVLQELLQAIQSGQDPVPIILRRLADLYAQNG